MNHRKKAKYSPRKHCFCMNWQNVDGNLRFGWLHLCHLSQQSNSVSAVTRLRQAAVLFPGWPISNCHVHLLSKVRNTWSELRIYGNPRISCGYKHTDRINQCEKTESNNSNLMQEAHFSLPLPSRFTNHWLKCILVVAFHVSLAATWIVFRTTLALGENLAVGFLCSFASLSVGRDDCGSLNTE